MSIAGPKIARTRGGTQPIPLTLDDVIDAAARVVAAEGLGRLTIKSVADELGVSSPAVYHYVPGKAELVDRVCGRVASSVRLDTPSGARWDEQIIALVLEMNETYARYPGVGERVLSYSGPTPAADAVAERVIDIAVGAGYPVADAARLTHTLQLVFAGWLLQQKPFLPQHVSADTEASSQLRNDGLSTALRYVLAGFVDGTTVDQS